MYAVMPNCNWKILQIQRKLPFLVLELWIPYGAWDTEPGRSGEAHLAEHVLIGIIRRNLSFYEQVNSYGYTNSYRIRISWIMEPSRLQERIGAIVNDLSRAALDQKLFDQEKSKVIQEINTIKKTDSLTLVEEVEQIIYQKKKEEVTAQGDTRQLEQIDFPSFLEKLKKVMNEEGIVFTLTGDIEDLNLFPNRQPLTEHTSQVSLSLKQGRDEMCLSLSTHDGDIKAFRWQIWDIGSAHAAEILETFLEFRSADERIRIRSVRHRNDMLFIFIIPKDVRSWQEKFSGELFQKVYEMYYIEQRYLTAEPRKEAERIAEDVFETTFHKEGREISSWQIWERFQKMINPEVKA